MIEQTGDGHAFSSVDDQFVEVHVVPACRLLLVISVEVILAMGVRKYKFWGGTKEGGSEFASEPLWVERIMQG
jgi:hypothetical protein